MRIGTEEEEEEEEDKDDEETENIDGHIHGNDDDKKLDDEEGEDDDWEDTDHGDLQDGIETVGKSIGQYLVVLSDLPAKACQCQHNILSCFVFQAVWTNDGHPRPDTTILVGTSAEAFFKAMFLNGNVSRRWRTHI
jgi:hypothetical protein